jgi:hypothetical protein
MPKFRWLIIVAVLLAFGSCVARKPSEPATVIQLETPAQADTVSSAPVAEGEAQVEEEETQLISYQQYQADYLSALASTSDLAEAEWNTFLRCRASAVALAAQRDAEANNTGIEAELVKRLRAVNTEAKSRAQGKRFYAHDAAGAGDFRDPAVDAIVLINLLQEMQNGNPSFPMCTQNAGSLWRSVDSILNSADEMARSDAQSVPVKVPKIESGEVANEPD